MRWRVVVLGGLLLGSLAVAAWRVDATLQPEISAEAMVRPWEVRGGFRRDEVSPDAVCSAHPAALYWVAATNDTSPEAFLASPPFAGSAAVELLVTGDLIGPDAEVYFERPSSGERVPVRVHAGELWRPVFRALPGDWLDKPVRLVARRSGGEARPAFGVSNPISYNRDAILARHLRTLRVVPELLLAFVLFLAPGLALALGFGRRLALRASYVAILGAAFSCLLGYAVFWAYFFNPPLGRAAGFALAVLGPTGLVLLLLTAAPARAQLRSPDLLAPLGLWLAASLFYTGVLFAADLDLPNGNQARARFTSALLPPDDALPLLLAHRLYAGADPRHLLADWHSSDRPPLQAGLVLAQAPVVAALGERVTFYYPLLGCVVQCSWIAAAWAVLRVLTASGPRLAVALLCLVFSGFGLVHSVYVWPKMLAAALALFPFALLLERLLQGRRPTGTDMALAGLGVGLGSLAHGGAGLFSVCLGVFLVRPRTCPGPRRLLAGAAVLLALMLPWLAYQRYYDPPGNRLAKIHLAGAPDIDDRPVTQALLDGYRRVGLLGTFRNKAENVKALFVEDDRVLFGGRPPWQGDADDPLGGWRRWQFHQLFVALGVFNAGWLVPVVALLRRRRLPRAERWALGFGLVGLALWVLLLFGPGATVIHHGPFAVFLLLFALLTFWVAGMPPYLSGPLVALHVAGFLAVDVFASPANAFGLANGPLIVVAAGFAAALAWVGWRLARARYPDGPLEGK
ncbi:MAG TPA: hypothetical protein VJ739_13095 [Gemmataceae bacterium]|nr:hypothetical protein [Gemmataceae bacterium]